MIVCVFGVNDDRCLKEMDNGNKHLEDQNKRAMCVKKRCKDVPEI